MAAKKPDLKAAPRRKAAKKPFDIRQLWRILLWGATAACALLFAVIASRSEVGAERMAAAVAFFHGQPAPPPFNAKLETQKLANELATAVRSLSSENDRLKSRLAAVEHHVDDVSGSLTRQIETVKAEAEAPRPTDSPPAANAPGVTNSVPPPAAPASAASSPFPAPPSVPTPPPASVQTPPPAKPVAPGSSSLPPKQFGVDIGTAVSVQALRARWAEIRAAHPQLFLGLTATAITREIPQSDRSELRLVLGPLPNSDAATRLCSSLVAYRLSCQPTGFDGQHVALQ